MAELEPCHDCGTWVCVKCRWKRRGANLGHPELQDCFRCKSRKGWLLPIYHRKGHYHHNYVLTQED